MMQVSPNFPEITRVFGHVDLSQSGAFVGHEVFVDSTIMNGRWSAIIGADGDDFSMGPITQSYPLSIGAPPSQVAPAIVTYMKSSWTGLTNLKAAATAEPNEPSE